MEGRSQHRGRWASATVAAAILGVFGASCSRGDSGATDIGSLGLEGGPTKPVAGLVFRSGTDGPSFANYRPAESFGVDDAVALFGAAAVCQTGEGDCVVRPNAQMWIEKVAASTAGGVCEGMALFTIDRFIAGLGPQTPTVKLSGDVNDRIVRLFATQFIPSVQEVARASSKLTLADSMLHVIAGLSAGGVPVTLGIYSDKGGHTLLPYAVEKTDDNRYAVWVYDPNWPLQERVLEIDTSLGSWRYAFDTSNQATDPNPWVGTAADLDVVDLSARQAPFAEAFDGAGAGRTLLTVTTGSKNWTLAAGDTKLAGNDSKPGDDGVMHVTRGAFGQRTVVVEVQDSSKPLELTADGALDLSLERPGRAVRLTSTGRTAVGMTLAADTALEVREGDATARIADPQGVVQVKPATGGAVTVAQDKMSITESPGAPPVVLDRTSDVRQDVTVENGTVREVAPPTVSEDVVKANDVGDNPAPVPTVPFMATESSVATTSIPRSTTSVVATSTTDDEPTTSVVTPATPPKRTSTTTTTSPKKSTTTTTSPKKNTTTTTEQKRSTTTTSTPATTSSTTSTPGTTSTTLAPGSDTLRVDGTVKASVTTAEGEWVEFSTLRTDSADEAYVWIDGSKVEPKASLEDGYYVAKVKFLKKDVGTHTVLIKLVRAGSVVRTSNSVTVTVTEAN